MENLGEGQSGRGGEGEGLTGSPPASIEGGCSNLQLVPGVLKQCFALPSQLSVMSGRSSNSDAPDGNFSPRGIVRNPVGSGIISHGVSMVSRVQERVEELRRIFDLHPDEVFMDEYYCALRKKILLQGRMYVFENFICFYSNLFGWVKKKVIPLAEVTEVSKKRHCGFPNSVQVVWKGKKEFFTSFLSQEDTYNLLFNVWSQARLDRHTSNPSIFDLQEETELHQMDDGEGSEEPPLVEPPSPSPTSKFILDGNKSEGSEKTRRLGKHISSISCNTGVHDSDLEEEDGYENEDWTIEHGSAPPIPEGMKRLVHEEFDCTVHDFYTAVFTNDATHFKEYHEARGDLHYHSSQWQKHSPLRGRVRHATFVSPVKSRVCVGLISPSQTECNQNQRYCVYEGEHLVFETSQVTKDIPYGDYFKVEMRWDVRPSVNTDSGKPGCQLEIHAKVPFIRHVLSPIKHMIVTSVMKEVGSSAEKSATLLKEKLADKSSSVSEGSIDEMDSEEVELPKRFRELLNRKDFRQRVIKLVQDEFGVIPRDAGSLLQKGIHVRTSVDLERRSFTSGSRRKLVTAPVGSLKGATWSRKFVAEFWSNIIREPVAPAVLLIFLVLIFQVVSLLRWIYVKSTCIPCKQEVYMATTETDRLKWVNHLPDFQNETQDIQHKLDVLVNAVNVGLEYIAEAIASHNNS